MGLTENVNQMRLISLIVVVSSCADFAINTIYVPIVSMELTFGIIFSMGQIVTVLFQFFSWFFLLSSIRQVKMGGYTHLFKTFWHLIVSTLAYLVFFLIEKIVVLSEIGSGDKTMYDMWNNVPLLILWSIERVVAVVHYSYSIYYVVKIFSSKEHLVGF